MPALKEKLKEYIKEEGHMTIARFMELCLGDAEHGYYMKKDPLGTKGDFITAPEVSQIFGEILGAWCANEWLELGSPKNIILVELGPGRGTLMKDFLRATRNIAGFHDAISIHLVETSPVLKAKQKENLKGEKVSISWHTDFKDVPEGPTLLVANEFFDAMPIHQFVKDERGWKERIVTLDEKEDLFRFDLAEESSIATALIPEADKPEGAIFEISPASIAITEEIASRIKRYKGAAIIIDYGYFKREFLPTFQAVKKHFYHDTLKDPGNADLTAHVDFSMLSSAAEITGINMQPIITQKEFLEANGIKLRADMLMQNADEKQREKIISDIDRLTGAEQMGELFKVLIFTSAR